jgi:hypothetical protein
MHSPFIFLRVSQRGEAKAPDRFRIVSPSRVRITQSPWPRLKYGNSDRRILSLTVASGIT